MKGKKWISLTMALIMVGNLLPMQLKADAASISDEVREDIIAINSYLLGILVGTEAVDINEDGCINAVDLTLAKRDLLGDDTPALKPLRADTWDIYLNEEATVTFTVQTVSITDPVILYDEADNVLAEMHDDGKNGDETARDSIYTATAVLSSDMIKNAGYYAAAGDLRSEPFEICFYRDLEDEDFNNFFELEEKISVMSFEEAAEFVEQSDEIKTYFIDEEMRQISFQCISGIPCIFEEPEETDVPSFGSGSYAVPDDAGRAYRDVQNAVESTTITPAHPNKKDVIVLRPTHGSDHPRDDAKKIGEIVADSLGGTLTCLDDGDVTLDVMRKLDSYGVVLISTHGVFRTWSEGCMEPLIQIGTIINQDANKDTMSALVQLKKYSADIESGRVFFITSEEKDADKSIKKLAVGKDFFDKHYAPNSLDDSFWYLGVCHSMRRSNLANKLIEKGAGAVVGYTGKASVDYCYSTMFEILLNSMILSADNVQKSVSEAVRIYGNHDPKHRACKLAYAGDSNFKLVERIGDEIGSSNIYTYNGHDYSVITSLMTWSEAEAYCEMHGGHLATVTSEGEERFIEQILPYYRKKGAPTWDFWLGATDGKKEGTWEWVTGEEFSYNKWRKFYDPDNRYRGVDGNANWLSISTFVLIANGKSEYVFEWEDAPEYGPIEDLNYKRYFICEWE